MWRWIVSDRAGDDVCLRSFSRACPLLQRVDLSKNMISTLGALLDLRNIKLLNLSNNQLSGKLPSLKTLVRRPFATPVVVMKRLYSFVPREGCCRPSWLPST